jgi:hypothetical protein
LQSKNDERLFSRLQDEQEVFSEMFGDIRVKQTACIFDMKILFSGSNGELLPG